MGIAVLQYASLGFANSPLLDLIRFFFATVAASNSWKKYMDTREDASLSPLLL